MFKRLLARLFGRKQKTIEPRRVSESIADAATWRGTIIPVERLPKGYVQRIPGGAPIPRKSLADDPMHPANPLSQLSPVNPIYHSGGESYHHSSSHDSGGYDSGSCDSGSSTSSGSSCD